MSRHERFEEQRRERRAKAWAITKPVLLSMASADWRFVSLWLLKYTDEIGDLHADRPARRERITLKGETYFVVAVPKPHPCPPEDRQPFWKRTRGE